MLSVGQIKAARAFLGWSVSELAGQCGVGATTIRKYEMQKGIPGGTVRNLQAIKVCLEGAGIEFLGNPESNPGVVLHRSPSA